jgi:hypothetical protein
VLTGRPEGTDGFTTSAVVDRYARLVETARGRYRDRRNRPAVETGPEAAFQTAAGAPMTLDTPTEVRIQVDGTGALSSAPTP